MIIEEIGIRGYKSFGNNEQILKLNTKKGELILLVGQNGSGKSSFLNSFDYVLFGKTTGRRKKWSTQSTLVNRINGEMLNRIKFISAGSEIEVKRGINPNILELVENGVLNERAGKSNLDDKIQEYIGMDVETFKSFISMSINDFKNFMALSNEEKQLLLDKLFNLEVINILNGILKEINKSNKIRISSLESEISTLEDSIKSIQSSIEKSIEKEKENVQVEIDGIRFQMESKKDEYKLLKEKIEKIESKDQEISDLIEKERTGYLTIQNEIKNIQKSIDLYDQGKCPTCSSDFNSDHFITLKSTLIEKREASEKIKLEIETNISAVREKKKKLSEISVSANKSYSDITLFLRERKSTIDKLTLKQNSKSIVNISEFEKSIGDLSERVEVSKEKTSESKDKESFYKELSKIFGEEGVKKSIIQGIVKPLNHFIAENVKHMGLQFDVFLDETFTAIIYHLGSPVDHETLSTGENKKINLCILVAYLKLIRTKKHINILFLDEVFASIDLDGIESILILLRAFANEYNVNIFVVHHAILNQENFDRIIKIEKNIFSNIIEMDISENG